MTQGTKEAQAIFTQINSDLNTQKEQTDKHKNILLGYRRQLRTQKEVNQDLSAHVVALEEEACVREAQVDGLVNSVDELCAIINSMMDWLCHCSEGKGKERSRLRSRRSPRGWSTHRKTNTRQRQEQVR